MTLQANAPRIMGILNITPDSFSDGGKFIDPETAFEHGMQMVEEGADIIDIGGESTRPGAKRIPAQDQIERIIPVIKRLKPELPGHVTISIDTTLSEVAAEAIEAGAGMINDISAGRDDPGILSLAAESGLPIILMHMQGQPGNMQDNPQYENVLDEIWRFLDERIGAARNCGIDEKKIIIDPGIGFGKTFEHNRSIIQGLDALVERNFPILLGASRKRFVQTLSESCHISNLTTVDTAITMLGMLSGVSIFRVHDVKQHRQTLDIISGILK